MSHPTQPSCGRPIAVLERCISSRETGFLRFDGPLGTGVLWLQDGEIVDCTLGRLRGSVALHCLVGLATGQPTLHEALDRRPKVMSKSTQDLLADHRARAEAWRQLASRLPREGSRVELDANAIRSHPLTLYKGERAFVGGLGHAQTVLEMVEQSELGPVATLHLIVRLLDAGWLRVAKSSSPPEAPTTPWSSSPPTAPTSLQGALPHRRRITGTISGFPTPMPPPLDDEPAPTAPATAGRPPRRTQTAVGLLPPEPAPASRDRRPSTAPFAAHGVLSAPDATPGRRSSAPPQPVILVDRRGSTPPPPPSIADRRHASWPPPEATVERRSSVPARPRSVGRGGASQPPVSPATTHPTGSEPTIAEATPTERESLVDAVEPTSMKIGRYEPLKRLGRGGMGTVYLVRASGEGGFSRLFALKVLRSHLTTDENAVRSLVAEARIASRLNHANVVGVVDMGQYGRQPYCVMEYVHGRSLADLLSVAPDGATPQRLVPILLDALAGLSAVHTATDVDGSPLSVVHHDVSPHNFLVGVDGVTRLTDFGIAGFLMQDGSHSNRGKPEYMSPERVRSEPADGRSDIFSLGVVLWTALTRHRLFETDTVDRTMQNVLGAAVPPPSRFGRSPTCLDPICLKALARSPAERYQSAQDMYEDLRRVATEHGLLGSPTDVSTWVRTAMGPQADTPVPGEAVPDATFEREADDVVVRDGSTMLLPEQRSTTLWQRAWQGAAVALAVVGALLTVLFAPALGDDRARGIPSPGEPAPSASPALPTVATAVPTVATPVPPVVSAPPVPHDSVASPAAPQQTGPSPPVPPALPRTSAKRTGAPHKAPSKRRRTGARTSSSVSADEASAWPPNATSAQRTAGAKPSQKRTTGSASGIAPPYDSDNPY